MDRCYTGWVPASVGRRTADDLPPSFMIIGLCRPMRTMWCFLWVCVLYISGMFRGGGEGSGHGVRVGRFAFLFGFVLSAWGLPVFWGHFFFLPLLIYRAQRLFPPLFLFFTPFRIIGWGEEYILFFPPRFLLFFSFFGFAYLRASERFFFPICFFPSCLIRHCCCYIRTLILDSGGTQGIRGRQ